MDYVKNGGTALFQKVPIVYAIWLNFNTDTELNIIECQYADFMVSFQVQRFGLARG